MYTISKQQQEELIKLLSALQDLPGIDTKTSNIRRRSIVMIKKLNKAKQVSYEYIKNRL